MNKHATVTRVEREESAENNGVLPLAHTSAIGNKTQYVIQSKRLRRAYKGEALGPDKKML